MSFLLVFLIAFLAVLAMIPAVIHMAKKNKWYDSTGERKIHTGQIPRLGGIGISAGFFIATIASLILLGGSPGVAGGSLLRFAGLLGAGFGYHLLGLVDDFRNLRARVKFLIQVILALAIISLGYYFRVIEIPVAPFRLELGLLGPVLTFFWILGITNALNLIDGMDGLAGGIALIGTCVWAVLYAKTGQPAPALLAISAAGAILGFLFYNFPPAAIFMGDSGSLLLGYLLSILPLLGDAGSHMETGLVPAVTICLIPILDTFAAIVRRWRKGVSFFSADKLHLHHKLLNLGFSARQILAIIYSICAILGISVISAVYVRPTLSFWLMLAGWAGGAAIFVILHLLKERNVRLIKNHEE